MNVYKLYFMRTRILVDERECTILKSKCIQILYHFSCVLLSFTFISPAYCLILLLSAFSLCAYRENVCMPMAEEKKNTERKKFWVQNCCWIFVASNACALHSVIDTRLQCTAHTIIKTSNTKTITYDNFQYIFEFHLKTTSLSMSSYP